MEMEMQAAVGIRSRLSIINKVKSSFKFGLAYDNVQLLVRDVKNTQRSISNQKRRNRQLPVDQEIKENS